MLNRPHYGPSLSKSYDLNYFCLCDFIVETFPPLETVSPTLRQATPKEDIVSISPITKEDRSLKCERFKSLRSPEYRPRQSKLSKKNIPGIQREIDSNTSSLSKKAMIYLETGWGNDPVIKAQARKRTKSERGSRYRGVSRNGFKWQVMVMGFLKKRYIGGLKSEADAARVYDLHAVASRGERVRSLLNDIG